MQDGASGSDSRANARSERPNDHTHALPSRILIELIRSVNPERASEIAEVLLFPGLAVSLSREVHAFIESGKHNPREFATMLVLFAREPSPVAPSNLAYALGLSIGVVRAQLCALEESGSVTHHRDPRRRRRTYVTLSHRGRVQIASTLVQLVGALEDLGRQLPPTAHMLLSHLCCAVRANASRHLSDVQMSAATAPCARIPVRHRMARLGREPGPHK